MKRFSSFFAIVAILFSASIAQAEWAILSGQFVFGGEGTEVPLAIKIIPTKDENVCCKVPLVNESLVINPKNRGIANVAIWAYKPATIHPSYEATAKDEVEIDNKNCRYEPHAVALRTGQNFKVSNSDPVGHNVLINFMKNRGFNPIIPSGGHVDLSLEKSEILPVKIGCSIHPWMQGVVLVQDHPYMAITDADGKFKLENLPAGELTLKVWHEKIGYIQTVKIDGKEAAWKKGKYKLNSAPNANQNHVYSVNPKLFAKK